MEENKYRNKIITISGEPVTGKGTNVKRIVEKLESMGYPKENIHVISAGNEFRKYFESVVEFIKNIDNSEQLKSLYEREEIKTIIQNETYKKKLIETIAILKSSHESTISSINIEKANNMPELSEIRSVIDTVIDEGIKEQGKRINEKERQNEVWIFDSRLAFQNIPESLSVRLTCRPDIAGKRLFEDKQRGEEDSNYSSIEEAIEQREKRKNGEIKRYKERYQVDLTDENNYDAIIDTSFSTVDDISDTILDCMDRYIHHKTIVKNWASPKILLPLQSERDTLGTTVSGNSFEDVKTSIQENGYNQDFPIEAIEVEGKKYIIEGHHRNFALASLHKTLIPYNVIAKDEQVIPRYSCTANDRAKYCTKNKLWGHEMFFDREGNTFSYSEIYPEIYEPEKQEER